MSKKRSKLDFIFLFLKGLSMGAANKVPGVSGGTVSYILSFYEEMIYSFQKINYKALLLLINGRFKSFFAYTNASFLVVLFSGSLFSYFSVSILLNFLLNHYELYVWSWFFGMIIGSIYYISKELKHWNYKTIFTTIVGVAIGLWISFLDPAKENNNLGFVFLCGVIGVSGMTLPGLSGSFLLILLGNYVLLLVDSVTVLYKTINEFLRGDFSVFKNQEQLYYLKVITSFTAGSFVGLVTISQLLSYVLKRWKSLLVAIILGFITGSLGIVWPWKRGVYKQENEVFLLDKNGDKIIENYQRYFPSFTTGETWKALFFILLGIVVILLIDRYSRNKNNGVAKK